MFTPPNMSRVTCHLSPVTCNMSHVKKNSFYILIIFFLYFIYFFNVKKLDKVVELVGEGSVINGAYPVQFQLDKNFWCLHERNRTKHELETVFCSFAQLPCFPCEVMDVTFYLERFNILTVTSSYVVYTSVYTKPLWAILLPPYTFMDQFYLAECSCLGIVMKGIEIQIRGSQVDNLKSF